MSDISENPENHYIVAIDSALSPKELTIALGTLGLRAGQITPVSEDYYSSFLQILSGVPKPENPFSEEFSGNRQGETFKPQYTYDGEKVIELSIEEAKLLEEIYFCRYYFSKKKLGRIGISTLFSTITSKESYNRKLYETRSILLNLQAKLEMDIERPVILEVGKDSYQFHGTKDDLGQLNFESLNPENQIQAKRIVRFLGINGKVFTFSQLKAIMPFFQSGVFKIPMVPHNSQNIALLIEILKLKA